MNILPKKRWHVRTRENISRVRKDEEEAAKECEEKKQRIYKAEQEAKTALLRERARAKYGISEPNSEEQVSQLSKQDELHKDRHVNFFEELEEGKIITTKTNPETEIEEKEKREKYEKQIGYLTYLGQDTVESTGNIPWYDKIPSRLLPDNDSHEEKSSKKKLLQDPLTLIKKVVPTDTKSEEIPRQSANKKSYLLEYHPIHKKKEKKKKHKKKSKKRRKKHSSCSSDSSTSSEIASDEERFQKKKSLEYLRAERLKREKEERERTEQLLARLQGKDMKEPKKDPQIPVVQQKYNSQYNPELAKQNFASFSNNR